MQWFKWIFSTVAFVLLLALGLILFVQSQWAKDKIGTVLEEVALQQGLKLKIEKIEGELPLKWTLTNVHVQISDTDTLDIERIRLRLAIMPLLRKHFRISYLSADHLVYKFIKNERGSCKTAVPQKIDDFDASSQGQQAGPCCAGETMPEWAGEIARRELAPKGRFYGAHEFCNCLESTFSSLPALPSGFSIRMMKLNQFEAVNLTTGEKAVYTLSGSCNFKKRTFDLFAKVHSDDLDLTAFIQGNKKTQQTDADMTLDVRSEKAFAPFVAIPFKIDEHLYLNVHLNGSDCKIAMKSDKFKLRKAAFTDGHLNLQAHLGPEGWKGIVETAADHPDLGFKGSSQFSFDRNRLAFQNLILLAPESSVTGDFAIDLALKANLSGGIAFQFNDLKPYSELSPQPLAGQIGGQIDFKDNDLHSHAIAKSCKAGPFISDQVVIDLFATDIFTEMKGKFEIEIEKSYFANLFFTSGKYSMAWNSHDWTYALKTQGEWKNPFDVASEGHFSYSQGNVDFHCNSFTGNLLQKNLKLQQPFTFSLSKDKAALSDFRLTVNEGYINSSFQVTPETSNMTVKAEHFPLDFLTLLSPRLSLQGLSSIDVALEGSNKDLVGHLNLLLEHADIFPAGTTVPIQTKANFQANLNHEVIQLHSHIVATGEQFVELTATIPLSYQVYPFKFDLNKEKTWAAQCTIEGHIEQLFDFINIGTQRFGGFLSTKLVSSGTLDKPLLFGPLSIQNGFYQNYFIGISLKKTDLQGAANGSTIDVHHIDLTDEVQGTASARGVIRLEKALPFSVEGHISHFRLVHFDWLAAACSGPFKLTGNLHEALAQGTLTIDEAEIQIPDQLPCELPTLPVTFINQPESYVSPVQPSTPYPFRYDLEIQGEKNVHLTGHGIDAELIGDIHLTGENLDITTVGSLKTNKGKFSFAGKDFKITQGEVSFTEGDSFINLTSNLDLSDLNVTVTFRGSFKSPQLNFQSNPPLPTSSILARILFNKDVSELNASQAGQLAYTIISLSGGSGPNLLETIHKNLGIDRLGITSNKETGKVSVQIGKYLTEGVMITLSQSTEQSHVIVEVELKGGFVLQAETHFNDQGKYIFKWNKNY